MTDTAVHYAPLSSIGLPPAALDTRQTRFALRVAARLSERAEALDPDLSERLRFAREKALARAREVRTAEAVHLTGRGMAVLGGGNRRWVMKMAALIPAVVLAGGLFMIDRWKDDTQISAAAEVDAALLSDDLPPKAYSDAGFAEYLKSPTE